MPVEIQTVQQAYKFALDATPRQQRMFASHAGGARYAYNWGLGEIAAALDAYAAEKAAGVDKPTTKIPGHFDLCKAWTAHKDNPDNELGWVWENFVGTYQAALRDAAVAWKNFFASRSGKRAGLRMGRPRFKSKQRSRRAFQVHGGTLKVVDAHHVKLPKIGVVKTHESTRKLLRRVVKGTARLVRGTVSQHTDGRWYIALTVEVEREVRTGPSARQRAGGAIGVDLGVRQVATCSDGSVIENPRHLHAAQRKLAGLQRALSRTDKDSRRRVKARAKLAKAHARVGHLRLDATQKATSALVHSHDRIVVEGWDVQRVAQHGSGDLPARVRRARNRALADAGIGLARWQLVSKSNWYGCTVEVADRAEATGRTCSVCGQVRAKPVPLTEEHFQCPAGHILDRRLNTARVLAKVGRVGHVAPSGGETKNARGGDVRPGVVRRAGRSPVKREARARPLRRGETGTPDPQGSGVPQLN